MSLRKTGQDGVKLVTTELRNTRVVPVTVQLMEPVAVAVLPANVVEPSAVKEVLRGQPFLHMWQQLTPVLHCHLSRALPKDTAIIATAMGGFKGSKVSTLFHINACVKQF